MFNVTLFMWENIGIYVHCLVQCSRFLVQLSALVSLSTTELSASLEHLQSNRGFYNN